jgi:hypothetical protein
VVKTYVQTERQTLSMDGRWSEIRSVRGKVSRADIKKGWPKKFVVKKLRSEVVVGRTRQWIKSLLTNFE